LEVGTILFCIYHLEDIQARDTGQTTGRTGHSLDTETADTQTQTRKGLRPRRTAWLT